MYLAHYLGLLHRAENELGRAFREIGRGHAAGPDVSEVCERLAGQCDAHARRVEPFARRYRQDAPAEPERLHSELFSGVRSGGLGLLRDLHGLCLMATECDISWTMVGRPRGRCGTARWSTRMKQAAPQALVVASWAADGRGGRVGQAPSRVRSRRS